MCLLLTLITHSRNDHVPEESVMERNPIQCSGDRVRPRSMLGQDEALTVSWRNPAEAHMLWCEKLHFFIVQRFPGYNPPVPQSSYSVLVRYNRCICVCISVCSSGWSLLAWSRAPSNAVIVELALHWFTSQLAVITFYEHDHLLSSLRWYIRFNISLYGKWNRGSQKSGMSCLEYNGPYWL